MRLAMLHPLTLIRHSLHLKLMLSAMLVIALIMAFSVYILYLGHAEEQAQKASVRMQENLSKLFSSKQPEPHAMTDLGKLTPDAIDPNLDTLICRADGVLSWSSLHMPEVVSIKETICRDLMRYLGGLDQDYFFKLHTIKNGESYFMPAFPAQSWRRPHHLLRGDGRFRPALSGPDPRLPLPLHSPGAARQLSAGRSVAAHQFLEPLLPAHHGAPD